MTKGDDHLRGFLVGLMGQLQHISLVRFSFAREEVHEEFSIRSLRQFDLVFAVDLVLLNPSISLVKALQQSKQGNLAVVPVDLLKVVDELGVGGEVPSDQRRVNVDSLSFTGVNNAVREVLTVDVGLKALIAESSLDLVVQLKDIDVVQVVEVLAIETSEGDHATTHEASAVSSSWFWVFLGVSADLQALEGVVLNIDDKEIVEIVTESTSEDVDLVIVDCT